jgi:hypothetical protein
MSGRAGSAIWYVTRNGSRYGLTNRCSSTIRMIPARASAVSKAALRGRVRPSAATSRPPVPKVLLLRELLLECQIRHRVSRGLKTSTGSTRTTGIW